MFRTKNTTFDKNHPDDNGPNLKTMRMGLGALRLK